MTGPRLRLRRGIVREAAAVEPEQQLVVELADGPQPAIADTALVGPCSVGDDVVVNVAARELALGSGGFDIVHVNLTSGLDAPTRSDAHVMKLNYSSLQHAVEPIEAETLSLPVGGSAAVLALHGQLAPLAWAYAQARPGGRLGYVQTAGGALPGGHSRDAAALRSAGLLVGHLTVAPCYGGVDGEALTTLGALHHALAVAGWDAVVCGPGPGIVGSATALGHGGMAAFDSAHAAAALGAGVVVVPRMSSADPRPRHLGVSHHTRTVLELLLTDVVVALPDGVEEPPWVVRHTWRVAPVDLAGYAASGLSKVTMGRTLADEPLFFGAALAAGRLLAG